MERSKAWRPIERVERMWLAHRFREEIARRQNEPVLLEKVCDCVEKLWRNPQQPGLNLEQIKTVDGYRILSARIDPQYRLILAALQNTEIGLLYFDNHDEAYRWVDQNLDAIPRLLQRLQELPRGAKPTDPVPFVAIDDADPLWIVSAEALRKMIEHGMAAYLAYLDEHQAYLAELDITQLRGPTLIKGGAGTGKTALAIARLRYLAARPEMGYGPALYLCYNRTLREAVVQILDAQYGGRYPRDQIEVESIYAWCRRYLQGRGVAVRIEEAEYFLNNKVRHALTSDQLPLTPGDGRRVERIADEIRYVLRPNGFTSVEPYLQLERKGMKFSVGQEERRAIWAIYQQVCADRSKVEFADLPQLALEQLQADSGFVPYRGVVIDEGQDFSPVAIRLAKALVGGDSRRLFVLADTAQSIYPSGFVWAQRELGSHGGQVRPLLKRYRSTEQIQRVASCFEARDERDPQRGSNAVYRRVRSGPVPELLVHFTEEDEDSALLECIRLDLSGSKGDGSRWWPDQIAVLAPQWRVLERLTLRLREAGLPVDLLDRQLRRISLAAPTIKLLTIHAAKGLDFPVVYVCGLYRMPAEAEPTPQRRALLYVGMTRAAYKLTLSTVFSQEDPLLYELDPSTYDLGGTAALQFAQRRDAMSSSGLESA